MSVQKKLNALSAEDRQKYDPALKILSDAKLLEGEQADANFDAVVKHQKPSDLAVALSVLSEGRALTGEQAQANFDMVVQHQTPLRLAFALVTLSERKLLTGEQAQANRDAVARHQDPNRCARALEELLIVGLLDGEQAQANRDAVAQHERGLEVLSVLRRLVDAKLYVDNQTLFNQLNQYAEILVGTNEIMEMWDRIPSHQMNDMHYEEIMDICDRNMGTPAQGRAEFIAYVNQDILGMRAQQQARAVVNAAQTVMNDAQSTHTASVHSSTDLLVWLLSEKYGTRRDAVDAFSSLSDSLKAFKRNHTDQAMIVHKVDAALRCLERLKSQASLIDLSESKKRACLAMAGEQQKSLLGDTATLEDSQIALTQYINWLYLETKGIDGHVDAWTDALYEIQRGYNLNEKGQETNLQDEDHPVCFGGTINKFSERLSGLSDLIDFKYINVETILVKLNVFFIDAMFKHCESLLNEGKLAELNALLSQLKDEDPSAAAPAKAFTDFYYSIKLTLLEALKKEFHTEESAIKAALNKFEAEYLPDYSGINERAGQLYSKNQLEKFKAICDAAAQSSHSAAPQQASRNGFFSKAGSEGKSEEKDDDPNHTPLT